MSHTRAAIVPRLKKLVRVGAMGRVQADIKDTSSSANRRKNFVALEEQCHSKYLLHLSGNGYSAGLKYKLACGSLVLFVRDPSEEFFYPGLIEGEHFVALPYPNLWIADAAQQQLELDRILVSALNMTLTRFQGAAGEREAERIALAGQRFALEQLRSSALECYWYAVLRHYELIFSIDRDKSPESGGPLLGSAPGQGVRARLRWLHGREKSAEPGVVDDDAGASSVA